MHSRRLLVNLGLCFGLTLLTACSALPPSQLIAPSLKFSSIDLLELGLNKVKFAVVIEANNVNTVDIPIRDLKFDVNLLGMALGSGNTKEPSIVLPQGKSVQIPLEFTAGTSQLIGLIRRTNWRNLETLSYQLSGSAQWGAFPVTIPFDRKGDLQSAKRILDVMKALPLQ